MQPACKKCFIKLTTMTRFLFIITALCISTVTFSQNKDEARNKVQEGIMLHDKGEFEDALKKYDEALALDDNNFLALAEKSITLLSVQRFSEAIENCEKAIDKHTDEEGLDAVYVSYGNALDQSKKHEDAIDAYNEGIRLFPDYYQLHFNKGITLTQQSQFNEAMVCFQRSVSLHPGHPGSHNAIARIKDTQKHRIPAVLAYCRFFVTEPTGTRASQNLAFLIQLLNGDVTKTGKNSTTITISSDIFADTSSDGKPNENNFTTTDLILSLSAAMDTDKKNKKKTEVQLFSQKMETMCASLKETMEENHGFFWEYYVPYFVEMNENGHLETFSYIVFASSDDAYISKWIKANPDKITEFYNWSREYTW